jgi:DNA-binding response OmpR family regulator
MKAGPTTVLVVDDDADIRDLLKILLEAEGYRVYVASDGLDAMHQLEADTEPALILLDLMMPRMDGEQFLKEMRSTRFCRTPVVVMSGHVCAQRKVMELEAAGCLMKPFERADLLKTVRRFASATPRRHLA